MDYEYDDVIENLNVLDYDYYFKVVDALLTEDVASILMLFDTIQKKGFDGDIFINGLAEHLRNLLVCKDAQTIQLLDRSQNIKERYVQQAALTPSALLITALDICNSCDIEYRMARNKRLHVEMALIKMTHIPQAIKVSQIPASVNSEEKKTVEIIDHPAQAPVEEAPKPVEEVAQSQESTPELSLTETTKVTESPAPVKAEEPAETPTPAPTPVKIKATEKHSVPKVNYADLLAEVKQSDSNGSEKEVAELSLEKIQEAWQAYLDEETKDSVRIMLQHATLELNDLEMVVTLGTSLAENTIRQENGLMDFIRKKIGRKDIILKIKVNKENAPEPPKRQKPLTSKEKYLKMRELNPSVTTLQKRFGLKPDED